MYFFTLREDDGLRMLESIVLSKIGRSQKDEEIRRWTELLHKQQLRYLYYSLDVVTITKSRMMKLGGGGHVASMWKKRETYSPLVGKPDRQNFEDLGVYEKIFLKWLLRKEHWMVWTVLIRLRIRTGGGSCEQASELSCVRKRGEFLD
jgi:hypothetical protein